MARFDISKFFDWLKGLFGEKGRLKESDWREAEPLKADRVDDLKAQGHVDSAATYIWVSGRGVDRRVEAKTHAIAWIEDSETRTRRKVVDSVGCVLMVELPEDASE